MKGYDTPQGNVYSSSEFHETPLFPVYAETVHKTWLGFIPPRRDTLSAFCKVVNWNQQPVAGLCYTLEAYTDATYSVLIAICDIPYLWMLRGEGFTYIDTFDINNCRNGIQVVEVDPCSTNLGLSFLTRSLEKIHYFEMAHSVTTTMNNVFDVFSAETSKLTKVRGVFESLTDVRQLRNSDVNL
jgi:hypothetical protein